MHTPKQVRTDAEDVGVGQVQQQHKTESSLGFREDLVFFLRVKQHDDEEVDEFVLQEADLYKECWVYEVDEGLAPDVDSCIIMSLDSSNSI